MSHPPLKPTVLKTASDLVFEQLAEAILDRRYAAGSALPAERVVAESCGTSRLIVRQAVHRLADYGMVRVRRGGATMVLDIDGADLRLFEVLHRVGRRPGSLEKWRPHLLESEIYSMVGPLRLAAARATAAQRGQLAAMMDGLGGSPSAATLATFEGDFWRLVVNMSGNPIFVMEHAWWTRVAGRAKVAVSGVDMADVVTVASARDVSEDLVFYRQLAQLLIAGENPLPHFLAALDQLLE